MEQMQATETYEETPHPEGWLKVEKLIDETWVTTGWAPNLKAFTSHADAVGGKVRACNETGEEVFSQSEYVASKVTDSELDVDNEAELCDNACSEHN